MWHYIENPKVSTKKKKKNNKKNHQKPKNSKQSKIAGYNINMQKSVAFLYTNNKLSGRESKKTIIFKIISKRIKYLGIKLSQK